MSFLLVVLRDLSAWISIFCNAQLTELGSKTGYRRLTSLKMSKFSYSSCQQLAFRSQFYAYLTSSQCGVHSRRFSTFTPVYLFWYMYESVDANFDDMGMHFECRARDLHDFFNVGWQTVGERKEHKIVMKSDIV